MADGGKTGELESPGSCYGTLQKIKRWISGLQSCGSRAIQNVILRTGGSCAATSSCLYLRQGSKKQQAATFSFGSDARAVNEASICNNFALNAAALA